MISELKGLHHVTSLTRDAPENNDFFTKSLGLRRVKKTVNFDVPDAYHLYYGTRIGAPGTIITYFPFPNLGSSRMGTGEVGTVSFSVPEGALTFWQIHFEELKFKQVFADEYFGQKRLTFRGLDGDGLALIESADDKRKAWDGSDISTDVGIRGLHSVSLRLEDARETGEFLEFMGYGFAGKEGNHYRYRMDKVREALLNAGWRVTQVKDRSYFFAIYFRSPGGVLFEIATKEPGFNTDEKISELGRGLMLPEQYEHMREELESTLPPIEE